MGWRALLSVTHLVGAQPEHMMLALAEEAPTPLSAKACPGCPLRIGGEWEAGALVLLPQLSDDEREALADGWGCHHDEGRRCAGMIPVCRTMKEGEG